MTQVMITFVGNEGVMPHFSLITLKWWPKSNHHFKVMTITFQQNFGKSSPEKSSRLQQNLFSPTTCSLREIGGYESYDALKMVKRTHNKTLWKQPFYVNRKKTCPQWSEIRSGILRKGTVSLFDVTVQVQYKGCKVMTFRVMIFRNSVERWWSSL